MGQELKSEGELLALLRQAAGKHAHHLPQQLRLVANGSCNWSLGELWDVPAAARRALEEAARGLQARYRLALR